MDPLQIETMYYSYVYDQKRRSILSYFRCYH